MINFDLLDRVLEWIEFEQEEGVTDLFWDQNVWITSEAENSCGTACCVAGYIALSSGEYISRNLDLVYPAHGPAVSISEFAKKKLGLTDFKAELLFNAGNDLARLKKLRNEFKESEVSTNELVEYGAMGEP